MSAVCVWMCVFMNNMLPSWVGISSFLWFLCPNHIARQHTSHILLIPFDVSQMDLGFYVRAESYQSG